MRLEVAGLVRAEAFESTNPMVHRMYPDNPLVYQDIFDAKAKGAIAKLGNPSYDETTYSANLALPARGVAGGAGKVVFGVREPIIGKTGGRDPPAFPRHDRPEKEVRHVCR